MGTVSNYVDVIIIGAGLSGIGAAYHLQERSPDRTYKILEARSSMGGTWDLFKYPGIRSDSDMYTLGYSFRPWKAAKAIADGPAILKYIKDTARDGAIDQHITYNRKVLKVAWSSKEAKWTVDAQVDDNGHRETFTCSFIFACSGYYSYEAGYTPDFKGMDDFKGPIIHPQKWTSDIEYTDKKVIVIGSGATAVTLVPELAKKASHVTMLQRSPTYALNIPAEDKIANFLKNILPEKWAYALIRGKNISLSTLFYNLCRKYPVALKKLILGATKKSLPEGYDVATHFNPKYNPWEERLCAVPDNDLFDSLASGDAEIVTDHIDRFSDKGILLKSGIELEADIIVTATGLKMEFLSNIKMEVDGKEIHMPELYFYRGMMFSDIPNFTQFIGYTNSSWTLKTDLSSAYICRLLNLMKKKGFKQVTPRLNDPTMKQEPIFDFSSGYVSRAKDILPKQGNKKPWKLYQNYFKDTFSLKYSKMEDGVLEFK